MAEQIKTHWKRLHNPAYLGAYSLMDGDTARELTVTLGTVKNDTVTGADGKKDECIVAQIVGNKPFIINATNAKTISKLYTPYIEDWKGKQITLFVAKARVAGEVVDALRIRPTVPKGAKEAALPDLNPQHEKWDGAITAITKGGTTLDAILKKYNVSDKNKALLFAPLESEITALIETKGDSIPEGALDSAKSLLQIKEYPKYFELLTSLKDI